MKYFVIVVVCASLATSVAALVVDVEGSTDGAFPNHDDKSQLLFSVFIIVTVVGLLSNIIVFFVIFCGDGTGKSITTWYVLQLTLADCALLTALPFFALQQLNNNWAYGSAFCTICQTIKYLNYYAGIFFLTAMSIDRCIAVTYSTRAGKLRTKTRTVISCVLVWCIAALASLPAAIYSRIEDVQGDKLCRLLLPGHQPYSEFYNDDADTDTFYNLSAISFDDYLSDELILMWNDSMFNEEDLDSSTWFPNYNITPPTHVCRFNDEPPAFYVIEVLKLCIGYLIPIFIISASYILIIRQLRKSEEKLRSSSVPHRNVRSGKRTQNMRKRVTRMVSALILCFALCWLPYHAMVLLQIRGFEGSIPLCYNLNQAVIILGYSNSALNPILYTFLGHKFRDRLSESLDKTRRRLSIRSWISIPLMISRKSSQQTRSFSKKLMGDHFSRDRRESALACTAGAGDSPTVWTEHQTGRDGKRVPLLENRKKEDLSWKQGAESNEKSGFLHPV